MSGTLPTTALHEHVWKSQSKNGDADTHTTEDRVERHLMRQRGAGYVHVHVYAYWLDGMSIALTRLILD